MPCLLTQRHSLSSLGLVTLFFFHFSPNNIYQLALAKTPLPVILEPPIYGFFHQGVLMSKCTSVGNCKTFPALTRPSMIDLSHLRPNSHLPSGFGPGSLTIDPTVSKLRPHYQGVVLSTCAGLVTLKAFPGLAKAHMLGFCHLRSRSKFTFTKWMRL